MLWVVNKVIFLDPFSSMFFIDVRYITRWLGRCSTIRPLDHAGDFCSNDLLSRFYFRFRSSWHSNREIPRLLTHQHLLLNFWIPINRTYFKPVSLFKHINNLFPSPFNRTKHLSNKAEWRLRPLCYANVVTSWLIFFKPGQKQLFGPGHFPLPSSHRPRLSISFFLNKNFRCSWRFSYRQFSSWFFKHKTNLKIFALIWKKISIVWTIATL